MNCGWKEQACIGVLQSNQVLPLAKMVVLEVDV
jgi:hypothetical protein